LNTENVPYGRAITLRGSEVIKKEKKILQKDQDVSSFINDYAKHNIFECSFAFSFGMA